LTSLSVVAVVAVVVLAKTLAGGLVEQIKPLGTTTARTVAFQAGAVAVAVVSVTVMTLVAQVGIGGSGWVVVIVT